MEKAYACVRKVFAVLCSFDLVLLEKSCIRGTLHVLWKYKSDWLLVSIKVNPKVSLSSTYVGSVQVEGLMKLMEGEHVGPFNLGNPGEFTMLELAEVSSFSSYTLARFQQLLVCMMMGVSACMDSHSHCHNCTSTPWVILVHVSGQVQCRWGFSLHCWREWSFRTHEEIAVRIPNHLLVVAGGQESGRSGCNN